MRNLIYLLAILFAVSSTTLVTSCGNDDPTEDVGNDNPAGDVDNGNNGNENGGNDSPGGSSSAMSSTQQKKKLEDATINFLEEFDAANFEEVVDFVAYVSEEYSEYEYDAVEEWGETCLEGMMKLIKSYTETNSYGNWIEHCTYKEYEMLLKISSFKGSFVAKNGRWKYTNDNSLSFTIKDESNKDCVLRLTTSGNEKKIYVGEDEDWEWVGYGNNHYESYYDIDVINNYISVPANINITIERGGITWAEIIVNTDLSSMKGDTFDLSRDRYNISSTFNFNGYSTTVDRLKYVPDGNGTELSYTVKHNKKNILQITLSSELDVDNDEFYGADNNNISVNLMNEVQFKGFCSDADKLLSLMDAAEECYDENEFKDNVRKMNNLINIGLYYDNKNVKHASVELEAFVYESYWGEDEWYCTPVIVFEEDGTSYSFEEFFDRKSFRTLINTFNRLIEDYEYLIEDAM